MHSPVWAILRRLTLAVVTAGLVLVGAPALVNVPSMAKAHADGTETLGAPSLSLAVGTGVVMAGVGMHDQPAALTLTVPDGASVEQVLLYYESGHDATRSDGVVPSLQVDGMRVEGTLIGGPKPFYGAVTASTYRADITELGLIRASPLHSMPPQRRPSPSTPPQSNAPQGSP